MTVADFIELAKLVGPAISALGVVMWAGVKVVATIKQQLITFIEVVTVKLQALSDREDARHSEMDRRLVRIEKELHGNGAPGGLVVEVAKIHEQLETMRTEREHERRVRASEIGDAIREQFRRLGWFHPAGTPDAAGNM